MRKPPKARNDYERGVIDAYELLKKGYEAERELYLEYKKDYLKHSQMGMRRMAYAVLDLINPDLKPED